MIQDMFDPEFYMGEYEVSDVNTKATSMKSGKYKDIAECAVCIISISKSYETLLKHEYMKNISVTDRSVLSCDQHLFFTSWKSFWYCKFIFTETPRNQHRFWEQCDNGETDFILCAYTRGDRLGQDNILFSWVTIIIKFKFTYFSL